MNKTKWWKWFFLTGVMLAAAFQVSRSIPQYLPSFQITDFEIIKQPDGISCGPTSVQMVLRHYGHGRSLAEIRKVAKTDWYVQGEHEVGGTTVEFVWKAINQFGVPSSLLKGDMHKLRGYVSQGRPVIVLVRSGTANSWHYVVVTGYTPNTIIIADPGNGRRGEYSTQQFERAWKFTHALWSGASAMQKCDVCGGDGSLVDWLGPLGYCDNCAGTGQVKDHWWLLLQLSEQGNYLMVVPNSVPGA